MPKLTIAQERHKLRMSDIPIGNIARSSLSGYILYRAETHGVWITGHPGMTKEIDRFTDLYFDLGKLEVTLIIIILVSDVPDNPHKIDTVVEEYTNGKLEEVDWHNLRENKAERFVAGVCYNYNGLGQHVTWYDTDGEDGEIYTVDGEHIPPFVHWVRATQERKFWKREGGTNYYKYEVKP